MLTVSPFASVAALGALVTLGLILAGVVQLGRSGPASAPRWSAAAGAAWAAGGVVLIVWPGVTIRVVAIVVGVSLVVGGSVVAAAVLTVAVTGRTLTADAAPPTDAERWRMVVLGGVTVTCGLLALSWPSPTLFVIALVSGVPVMLAGAVALLTTAPPLAPATGGWMARHRPWRAVAALSVALALLGASVWRHAGIPRPDAFYTSPAGSPVAPGVLLRGEPYERAAPAGARAWRILYTTTRDDRTPAVASALIIAAARLPPGPRPVIAWAHGATGITPGCAPSLLDDPLGGGAMPGLDQAVARGWVVVATDYAGLGTPGPHPFLIGQGEARSVLDAVRAAHHLAGVTLAQQTIVWGHSQGGNAALWTGIIASGYAPDAGVIGVAGLAPGTNLPTLARLWGQGKGDAIFAAYLIQAYADTYPDVRVGTYVRASAEIQTRELASQCLSASPLYLSGISSLLFGQSIWATDPATGAFGQRLRENIPTGPIPVPVLIGQGSSDTVVTPASQTDFVHVRCASGNRVDYRVYPDRTHVGLIAPDSPLIPDLVRWTQDRLDGKPAGSACPT